MSSTSSEEEFLPKKRKHKFWEDYTDEDGDKREELVHTKTGNRFMDVSSPVNYFVKSGTEEEEENQNVPSSTTPQQQNNEQQQTEEPSDDSATEDTWNEPPGLVTRKQRISSHSLPKNFGVVRKVKSEYLFMPHNDNHLQPSMNESSQGTQYQLGSWEKYTKGFGSKMLQKMGFTGRLGAYEQGLVKPLEPQVRPKNLGLAADGFQEKSIVRSIPSSMTSKSVSNSIQVERQSIPEKKRWKKKPERDLSETNRESTPKSDIVIDMRGPEKRYLNHVADSIQHDSVLPETFLPELQYNIRMLKDLAKVHLEQSSEQVKMEQRRLVSLRSELKTLQQRLFDWKETKRRLEYLLELIKEMESSISFHELIDIVRQGMEQYPECLESHYILEALTACAHRHLNAYFGKEYYWTPKIPDTQWIQDIAYLGNILGGRDESKIYLQLLWNTIVIRIKRYLSSSNFHAQQPHDLVYFIESCYKVFPDTIMESLAADIVYPRLRQEVQGDWELSESLMPHQWIFPWLPLLGRRRVGHLFDYIWKRIGKCVRNWHPSESFVRQIIEPWVQIAKKNSLSKLFHQYIIPRLESTLKEELIMKIPNEQNSSCEAFSVFYWIISWYGILENEALAGILLRGFFPVWLQTLVRWLQLQDVDWEQVTIWYDLWKQKFPLEIQRMNNIRRAFDIALDVMNRSMMGENTKDMDIHRMLLDAQISNKQEDAIQVYDTTSSFKDLVGYFAERNGVTLVPCNYSNRLQEPIYLFGNIPIRLHHQQQVVYYQNKTEWKPIALQDLLKMVKVVEQKHEASYGVAE